MINKSLPAIDVYTDGSCDTQFRIGGWVAIILYNNSKTVISGTAIDTTHNRMEMVAVIEAVQFIKQQINEPVNIFVFSDSQYVTDLPKRKNNLETSRFLSRKGTPVQNDLLVKLNSMHYIETQEEFRKKHNDFVNHKQLYITAKIDLMNYRF